MITPASNLDEVRAALRAVRTPGFPLPEKTIGLTSRVLERATADVTTANPTVSPGVLSMARTVNAIAIQSSR